MSGALFSAGTAIYTIVCPLWGYAADHGLISKTKILIAAAVFIIIGFSFLGPLPFLPYATYVIRECSYVDSKKVVTLSSAVSFCCRATWAGFVGYAIHGIGIGGSIMTAYHNALEAAV